jgi:hypothetical protein
MIDTKKVNIFFCSIKNIRKIFKLIKYKKDHLYCFKIACEAIYEKFKFDICMITNSAVVFILLPFSDDKSIDYGEKNILACKISSMLLAIYYYELTKFGITISNDIIEDVYSKCIIESDNSISFLDDFYFEVKSFNVVREMAPFEVKFQKKVRDFEKEKEDCDNSEPTPIKKKKFYKLEWKTHSGEKLVGRIFYGDIIKYIKSKLKDFPVKDDELEERKIRETKTVVSSGSKRYRYD